MKKNDDLWWGQQKSTAPQNAQASSEATGTPQKTPPIPVVPKKMDVGSEALLGMLNGVIAGGALSSAGSIAYSYVKNAASHTKGPVFSNITGAHLGVVAGGTAAVAAINTLVRASHAMQRNAWCDKVDAQLTSGSYAQKLSEEADNPPTKQL